MADFLELINEKYQGKYSFLRIKSVEVSLQNAKLTATFLIPAEEYDTVFDSEMQNAIKECIKEQLPNYDIKVNVEKIFANKPTTIARLKDYMAKRFPFVFGGIVADGIELSDDDVPVLTFKATEDVKDYAQNVNFESDVKEYLHSRFCLDCVIAWESVENAVIEETQTVKIDRRSTLIPISNRVYLAGRKKDLEKGIPVHIASVKSEVESVLICGEIKFFEKKEYEDKPEPPQESAVGEEGVVLSDEESERLEKERAKKKRKPKRFCYKFSLYDITGTIKVRYYAEESVPELEFLKDGETVMVRGRCKYNEMFDEYSISAVLIAYCEIDFEVVKEQLKKLPPPDNYTELKPFELKDDDVVQLGFVEEQNAAEKPKGSVCALYCSYVKDEEQNGAEDAYELACVRAEDGAVKEALHTFLKIRNVDSLHVELRDRVFTAPKLDTVIPDLLKFIVGAQVVVWNQKTADSVYELAEAGRYERPSPDFKNISAVGLKKGEENKTFEERCASRGIPIGINPDALSCAKAMIKYYIFISKKK